MPAWAQVFGSSGWGHHPNPLALWRLLEASDQVFPVPWHFPYIWPLSGYKSGYQGSSECPGSFRIFSKPWKSGGEEAYDSATCLSRGPATKTLTLKIAPKVHILVLKRFCDFTGDKISRVVQSLQRSGHSLCSFMLVSIFHLFHN
jgi:hypothetical protein